MVKYKNAETLLVWLVDEEKRKEKRRNNIIIASVLLIIMSGVAFFSFISGFNAGVEKGIKISFSPSPFYLKGLNAGRGMPRDISAIHHDDFYKIVWSVRDGEDKKTYILLEKNKFRIFLQLNGVEAKKISDSSVGISEIYIENGKIKNIYFDFTMCNFFRLSDGGKKIFQYCRRSE